MKKLILLAATVLFALNGVNAQTDTKTATPAKTGGAAMKFEHLEYDYGTIKQGDVVEHLFTFTSTGSEPVIISQAQGSCGCTVPEWPKQPLKKGEKGSIKVTFNSAGKMGVQDKTVTLTSNAGETPIVLHIKGTIEAAAVAPEAKPTEKPHN
jgi:Protein of unknown function (DUF1573)